MNNSTYPNKFEFHKNHFNIKNNEEIAKIDKYITKIKPIKIECSCKIKKNEIIATRVNFWSYADKESLKKNIEFFKIFKETFNLSSEIIDIFKTTYKNSKIQQICAGIDSQNNNNSRLKLWFICENFDTILKEILPNISDSKIKNEIINNKILFGYDFYKNKKTEFKIYPLFYPEDIEFIQLNKILNPKAIPYIENSIKFYTTYRTDTNNKIIHIKPKNTKKLIQKINNPELNKIYEIIKEYDTKNNIIISLIEEEIINQKIENINIYY